MPLANTVDFDVNVKGELTGKQFAGLFVCKTKLSVRDTLAEGALYRQILGPNPNEASLEQKSIALAHSFLAKRITKAPSWWADTGGCLDMDDMNVLAEVYQAAVTKVNKEYEVLEKEAAAAQPVLKTELEKG
jgi:hypothetical protein